MYNTEESYKLNHLFTDILASKSKGWYFNNGLEYYINDDGTLAKGLVRIDGRNYFFDEDNVLVKGEWRRVKGDWYCFDGMGRAITGSEVFAGREYYFDEIGRMQTGLVKINNTDVKYFHDKKGYVLKGWIVDGDKIYFADNQGNLVTGQVILGDEVFYFEESYNLRKMGKTPDGRDIDENGRVIQALNID